MWPPPHADQIIANSKQQALGIRIRAPLEFKAVYDIISHAASSARSYNRSSFQITNRSYTLVNIFDRRGQLQLVYQCNRGACAWWPQN